MDLFCGRLKLKSFGCGSCGANLKFLYAEHPTGERILIDKLVPHSKKSCYIFRCMNCGKIYKLRRGEVIKEEKSWRIA